jgi:hypothetical protein
MKTRVLALVAAIGLGLGLPAQLAGAPNFSGEWRLNPAKSEYGSFPAPAEVVRKIRHNEPSLTMTTQQKGAQGQVSTELTYTTDGKEVVNKLANGESRGSAHWDNGRLVIESTREVQGTPLKSREVWSLSTDERVLTVTTHLTLPQGEFDVRQVFERQ